jgi:hypothetical protein
MSDTIFLLSRSDTRHLKATNISFLISESISPSFLKMKMNTPSLLRKFASFLLSSINTHRSRKPKIMHEEASTQIIHPFAEAENKTLFLFVNVKQKTGKV